MSTPQLAVESYSSRRLPSGLEQGCCCRDLFSLSLSRSVAHSLFWYAHLTRMHAPQLAVESRASAAEQAAKEVEAIEERLRVQAQRSSQQQQALCEQHEQLVREHESQMSGRHAKRAL